MYVITGATGNTGSVVANELLARGQQVRVLGRNQERLQQFATKGAEPFTCDLADADALTKAFRGAQAVYAMIPPNMSSEDYGAEQSRMADAIGAALAASGVQHAVVLSSMGADKPEGTGPVLGLRHLEQLLNRIAGLNVLHLRPGYFMENTLEQLGMIQAAGMAGDTLRPDLKIPMIATRDIGRAAAEALLSRNFRGQQTRELQGQRDLTMTEAITIVGNAIGKRDLGYRQLPEEKVRAALVQMGLSESAADMILELSRAMNTGHIRALEARSAQNTTPTSYETFVAEEVVPRYRGRSAAG